MPKIRVLIVDDSVVIRRMISEIISRDPMLELAGVAPHGRIALQKIPQLNPDIVTLDVEMPEMDGITTLREIRKIYPKLPVIMFSTLTERGATTTVEALAAGASDYVAKPANVGSVSMGLERLQNELLPKIKALCGEQETSSAAQPAAPRPVTATVVSTPAIKVATKTCKPVEIVCIGSSTGGPNALAEVFREFPGDFPVPIVIVQHMPPVFTKFLAERLSANSALKFSEAVDGELLKPGHAYIAPGGRHMEIVRQAFAGHVHLQDGPAENSCRPAVDVLFRSVAKSFNGATLGVVLTGMGRDGLRGCELIHEKHGNVFAQDEATSVVWGMPRVVAQSNLADKILPLGKIRSEIIHHVQDSQHKPLAAAQGGN